MQRREVEHQAVARVAQKRTPLHPSLEILGQQRHVAPLGHQPADLQAPVRVQIVHHPVIALLVRVLLPYMAKWATQSRLVRVSPRSQTTFPVGTMNEFSSTRVP